MAKLATTHSTLIIPQFAMRVCNLVK